MPLKTNFKSRKFIAFIMEFVLSWTAGLVIAIRAPEIITGPVAAVFFAFQTGLAAVYIGGNVFAAWSAWKWGGAKRTD
jgi:hypothetical protein